MTCIGNSGPLRDDIRSTIKDNDLVAAAVVSANRNFEGRVSPYVKANYLASPPLVIAFAIAGRVDIDLDKEPLGVVNGKEVFLRDIWPDDQEINSLIEKYVTSETFKLQYNNIFKGSFRWDDISIPEGALYAWDEKSTYIQNPPFFNNLTSKAAINNISNARALASLGDSITTDHISPAGEFSDKSDAGKYLISLGIKPADFNSYGSRRGNHEIMMRGTFANIRLRNKIAPGTEGGYSRHMPDEENGTMFEISQKYISENTPLIVIAGKEYGTGSSRDWAAKGPFMLGIKAVIAESFERIHRSNLIGMGIIPLQFIEGENAESLGLDGTETFDIELENMIPKSIVTVTASKNVKSRCSCRIRIHQKWWHSPDCTEKNDF